LGPPAAAEVQASALGVLKPCFGLETPYAVSVMYHHWLLMLLATNTQTWLVICDLTNAICSSTTRAATVALTTST